MTIFDTETDRYLERLGTAEPDGDWDDVLRRADERARRARRSRLAVGGAGAAVTAAAVAFAAFGSVGGESIVDKAEAAVLAPVRAADGTIEHLLLQYRTDDGAPFIEYETWIAADGAWCRRTVEGLAGADAPDTRLTRCRAADGTSEVYLPATGEILRTRPDAAADGAETGRRSAEVVVPGTPRLTARLRPGGRLSVVRDDGKALTAAEVRALPPKRQVALKLAVSKAAPAVASHPADPGPAPGWLTQDVVEQFRRNAVREAGEMRLDGRTYAKLVTGDGRNTILVDRTTGEARAWIPAPGAFGAPTTVVRTRETLPDDAATRRSLSLTTLHPEAPVRDVTPAERDRALDAQYPRG